MQTTKRAIKKTNDFHFKTFSVVQQKNAMKVNTDSVILGAWTQHSNPKKALDIGTGTGLLALMLAHKHSNLSIDAIEIDKNNLDEASHNFDKSIWKDRITAEHIALQDFAPQKKYDIIITNPPYFINSSKNKTNTKTQARHTDNLSFEEIITFALSHLSVNGILSLILPKTESEIFEKTAQLNQLHLSKKLLIKPLPNKNINRVAMEFKKSSQNNLVKQEHLTVYKSVNQYSSTHYELTRDFYLNKL